MVCSALEGMGGLGCKFRTNAIGCSAQGTKEREIWDEAEWEVVDQGALEDKSLEYLLLALGSPLLQEGHVWSSSASLVTGRCMAHMPLCETKERANSK